MRWWCLLLCLAVPAPALSVTGGEPRPVLPGLGEIVDHGTYLAGRCVALRVAPGWILTAHHCTGFLREWRDGHGRHALGRVHRAPRGGDIALVESPGNIGAFTPVADVDAGCGSESAAVIHSRGHTPRGAALSAVDRELPVVRFRRCDEPRDVIGAQQRSICRGDSGSPLIQRGRAVAVVATLLRDEDAPERCSRPGGEIGQAVAVDGQSGEWIRRTVLSAPPPLGPLRAMGMRTMSRRAWVSLAGPLPVEGTPARLIDQHGRVRAVAPVAAGGDVLFDPVPAGRYRVSVGWGSVRRVTRVVIPPPSRGPYWAAPAPGEAPV